MVGELTPKRKRILLAGGGHAHILALSNLEPKAAELLDITMVSPSAFTYYSGALPGAIAGHWDARDIRTNVRRLCAEKGVSFVDGTLTGIDADARQARLASGETLPYDLLSLDIGSTTRELEPLRDAPGVLPIRPIPRFLDGLNALLEEIEASATPATLAVVGSGLAGIEIALALRHRLNRHPNTRACKVCLIEAAETALPGGPSGLRRPLNRALNAASIELHTGTAIERYADGYLAFTDGKSIPAALVINCTGAASHDWLEGTSLKTHNGFVEVDTCLRSTSHPDIWAAGDVAYFAAHPLPPAGVFAVREGPVLAENLLRFAEGKPLRPYDPQTDYLKLVSLGAKRAIAEKNGLVIGLPGLWHLKKSIDFSFLNAHAFATSDSEDDAG